MNLTQTATDNLSEVLTMIIQFTEDRHKILADNLVNINKSGFVPKDLAVQEFASVINHAVNEHCTNKRLVVCDTDNIKFGANNRFKAHTMIDEEAKELFDEKPEEYLKLQTHKISENSLNRLVARELLKQKIGKSLV